MELSLLDEQAEPRAVTLIYGGPGAGKTTLLRAVAATRPGYVSSLSARPGEPTCFACCDWLLGIDEPDRLHPLRLVTPNAPEEFAHVGLTERREIAFFERLARDGGFAFLLFSALRWFSKPALSMNAPARSVARYDVRSFEPPDDAGRNDLARDTKQALAYAAITSVLPNEAFPTPNHVLLGSAMSSAVDAVASLFGYHYIGLEPKTLEPAFASSSGRISKFDALPSQVKHAVAVPALIVRVLWGAYPNLNPRKAQGLVAIDQLELHQEDALVGRLMETLVSVFPNLQWLITTRSPALLASRDAGEIVALRRSPETGYVNVHAGEQARLH